MTATAKEKEHSSTPTRTRRPAPRPDHYLVPVDDSEATTRAISYLASLLESSRGPTASVTLLHVLRVPPRLAEHGGAESPEEEIRRERTLTNERASWIQEAERSARPLLDRVEAALTRVHVPRERIHERFSAELHEEISRDTLDAAREAGCGTIVVGRSSFPWYRELTERHVADELVEHAEGVAICVVR
jgi:Universal stress protein family